MRIGLCAFPVLAAVLVGCKEVPVGPSAGKTYPDIIFTEERPEVVGENRYVCWGETKDGLAFVVFEDRTPPGGHRVSSATNSKGVNEGWLLKPDGTKVQLPTDAQLHEVIGGEYRQREGRVTKTQLKAFLESKPKEYTIDALLRFVNGDERPPSATRPR